MMSSAPWLGVFIAMTNRSHSRWTGNEDTVPMSVPVGDTRRSWVRGDAPEVSQVDRDGEALIDSAVRFALLPPKHLDGYARSQSVCINIADRTGYTCGVESDSERNRR